MVKFDGSESFGVPVQGFEPADKYADAPPLVVEIHVDAIAAAGYPLGGALPLIAVLGGGLYESELVTLTAALVAHAVECVEDGPLAFGLTAIAEEKATEICG